MKFNRLRLELRFAHLMLTSTDAVVGVCALRSAAYYSYISINKYNI